MPRDLGHRFADPTLLDRALTHRSFGADHNERLEFLGDAVLNLAVSELLFARFPAAGEGELTRLRAHLVREASLHEVALALGVPAALKLSEGEARGGGAQRPSMLADAVEALVAAVFLDAGWAAARATVERLLGDRMVLGATGARADKDAKTALQEWLQARRHALPTYTIVATHGQDHAQTFDVRCEVAALGLAADGRGRSRRAAEQQAAQRLLSQLGIEVAAEPGASPAPPPPARNGRPRR